MSQGVSELDVITVIGYDRNDDIVEAQTNTILG